MRRVDHFGRYCLVIGQPLWPPGQHVSGRALRHMGALNRKAGLLANFGPANARACQHPQAADLCHPGRAIAHQSKRGDHVLKAGLALAHLPGPHDGGHFPVPDHAHRAGRQAAVDGINDDQGIGFSRNCKGYSPCVPPSRTSTYGGRAQASAIASTQGMPNPSSAKRALPIPRISPRSANPCLPAWLHCLQSCLQAKAWFSPKGSGLFPSLHEFPQAFGIGKEMRL
jgi:hypothetical protein